MIFSNGMSLPDTAWVQFEFASEKEEGDEYLLSRWTSGGSHKFYTGGFEITVSEFDNIDQVRRDLINSGAIPYYLQVRTVKEQNREIFSWLNMLDLNVDLIIGLMVLIAIVNMTSALLIIILERVGMIGLLKTMGMTSWSVVKIFMIHASRIITKGFVIGNLLGFGFALIQWKFGLVSLDPEFYYLSKVPIHFSWQLLYIQILCLVTCFAFMIFPALYVGTIQPAKAIRFD
ncbi:MAG: FtsX-like permease family protein [Bacteroidota bacterium]